MHLKLISAAILLQVTAIAAPPKVQANSDSELRTRIEQFSADESNLLRIYDLKLSAKKATRLGDFYRDTLKAIGAIDFEKLSFDGRVDYVLLKNDVEKSLRKIELVAKDEARYGQLVPFAGAITELEENRRRMVPIEPDKVAVALNALRKQVDELKPKVGDSLKAEKFQADQAAQAVAGLRGALRHWYEFYNGYDPLFTWWAGEPYKSLDKSLDTYYGTLKEKLLGVKPDDDKAIIGNPIGREALMSELEYALIPYTPEELIAIGEKQYAWCEAEMKKAARELGYGDDWRKAQEHVKTLHVDPGKQPALIHELATEAIKFVEDRDLVTVPPLAKETWKMEMMSPERQLVSPFFLGGADIIVSFPTDTMTHEQKMMSMRGNNRYFSRATVQHELIPGHHLQWFMTQRYKPYRGQFWTPFWTEGWALYWEMLLWDLGFPKTPEEKIGMLFWRMHRCIRIVFSLRFHLGEITPQQCIDMLVERVGHERENAEGEVRRSLNGTYEPLYQLAYMMGGLQFRALHEDLVKSGKMTNRQFHDAILKENSMPIEVLRTILTKQAPSKDFKTKWRFAG